MTNAMPKIELKDHQFPWAVKIWIYFLCGNIKPTEDQRHTTKDRLDIVYNIMHRQPVNVGRIIWEEIFRVRNYSLSSHLFPCLITKLCRQVGVVLAKGEPKHGPAITMTDKHLLCYRAAAPLAIRDEEDELLEDVELLEDDEQEDGDATTSSAPALQMHRPLLQSHLAFFARRPLSRSRKGIGYSILRSSMLLLSRPRVVFRETSRP